MHDPCTMRFHWPGKGFRMRFFMTKSNAQMKLLDTHLLTYFTTKANANLHTRYILWDQHWWHLEPPYFDC